MDFKPWQSLEPMDDNYRYFHGVAVLEDTYERIVQFFTADGPTPLSAGHILAMVVQFGAETLCPKPRTIEPKEAD